MHKQFKTVLSLSLITLLTFPLHAQQGPTPQTPVEKDWKFYGTHAATSFALSIGIGYGFQQLNIRPLQYNDDPLKLLVTLATIYPLYKLPQWTDTYILKNNIQRSTKQNIVRLITNGFTPVGPFVADYCMDLKTKEQLAALETQQTSK